MNGFEPLRRRVIDYTVAGQWQEVYDGPIEECEEYRLQAENAKLRELLSSYWKRVHSPAAPNVERDYLAEMRELGIEVDG